MTQASLHNSDRRFASTMKTCLLSLFCIMTAYVNAQHNKLPPFRMLQEDNKVFGATQLPMGRPIVLVYFLPDCEHCQLLTKNIVEHIHAFDKTSVAMVTYYPTAEVGKFSRKYGLDKHPNFYLGTEGNSFFLKKYYHLSSLPFLALYAKNGDLVKTYYDEKGFPDLLSQLKSLER
ncbi:MAG: hypothetical protein QM610_04580 [Chitinophagaceae bacterium]